MDLFSVEERVWEEVLKAVGKKMKDRLMSVSVWGLGVGRGLHMVFTF